MKNLFLLFTVFFTINFCSTQSDSSNQNSSNPDLSTLDPSKSFDGKYQLDSSSSNRQIEIKDGKFFLDDQTKVCYLKSLKDFSIFKITYTATSDTSFTQMKLENNILYGYGFFDNEQEAASTTPTFSQLAIKIQ